MPQPMPQIYKNISLWLGSFRAFSFAIFSKLVNTVNPFKLFIMKKLRFLLIGIVFATATVSCSVTGDKDSDPVPSTLNCCDDPVDQKGDKPGED